MTNLQERLLSIGSVLHRLEAVAGGPSVTQERAVALAALSGGLVDDAREQAERLLEAIQGQGSNGGGTPKRQKPDETADVLPLPFVRDRHNPEEGTF
jgi:hypothetical protein